LLNPSLPHSSGYYTGISSALRWKEEPLAGLDKKDHIYVSQPDFRRIYILHPFQRNQKLIAQAELLTQNEKTATA
jgi:hypothetical protein